MKPLNHRILRKYIKDNSLNYFTDQYLQSLNIHCLYHKKSKKEFFTLKKKQTGGERKFVTVNKNRYEFELDIYDDDMDEDNKRKEITIFNLEDENIGCGIIIVDKQTNEGNIQSISNYKSCLKCIEQHNDYKVGDVIVQILIALSRKMKLKKLTLQDNSYLTCHNSNISLIHLRTMTKGEPYYCKFGFTFTNKKELDFYKKNLFLFSKQICIKKEKLIKIIIYRKFDNIKDKKILKYINTKVIPRLEENNLVSEFIKNIINDNNNESCELLYNIYMDIYRYIGYIKYTIREFELKLI